MRNRARDRLILLRDRLVLGVRDKGIPAKGDDCGPAHETPPFGLASSSARAARASLKPSLGAVVMPAPIWPMPAFWWAMPVLMIGSTPESATRRASMPAGVPPKLSAGRVNAGLV